MTRALAIDFSRLFLDTLRRAPSENGRIQLLHARHFLESWPGPCFATLPTMWGLRLYDRERALRATYVAEYLWGEVDFTQGNEGLRSLEDWLAGRRRMKRLDIRSNFHLGHVIGRLWGKVGISIGQPVRHALPQDAIYLNVGHVLSRTLILNWLKHRPDVKAVFMLHDLLPLKDQQSVSAAEIQYSRRVVANVERFAAGLIVPTNTIAQTTASLKLRPTCETLVAPLPVSRWFATPTALKERIAGQYFVVCGPIEPRKNHMLLINVWRELVSRYGSSTPKLVIVDSSGEASNGVRRAIDVSDRGYEHILEAGGLTTPQLATLMRDALAVLMPSFVEGFGLPIAEALSLGTPVLASDLPAHREAGRDAAIYLSPNDPDSWFAFLRTFVEDPSHAQALRAKVGNHQAVSSSEYFRSVDNFLHGIPHGALPPS